MPFCPRCRSEYRVEYKDEFGICPDCRVPLVDNLPSSAEETDDHTDYRTVFIADEPEEAAAVRRILEEHSFPYRAEDEGQGETDEGEKGTTYVEFMVREDRYDEAVEALKSIVDQETGGIGPTEEELKALEDKEADAPVRSQGLRKGAGGIERATPPFSLIIIGFIGLIATLIIGHSFQEEEGFVIYIIGGIAVVGFITAYIYSRDKQE